MRRLTFLSLAAVAAGLAAPASVVAGDDGPTSRSEAASPHKHLFGSKAKGHVCAKCAAAKAGQVAPTVPPPPMMAGAQIVGCAHSANGVCKSCQTLLAMPGEVTMVSPSGAPAAPTTAMAAAPGRAVASDTEPGHAMVASGDPQPIGVMQTNYNPNPTPASVAGARKPGPAAMPTPAPAGRTPFLPETHEANPHILSHLFGFAAVGRDVRESGEAKVRRKREAHAATAYGPTDGQVNDLPASAVYGKGAR